LPGHDPLSWKIFDHMCEKSSRIRDHAFAGRPKPALGMTENG
jgi:hypothetical protein